MLQLTRCLPFTLVNPENGTPFGRSFPVLATIEISPGCIHRLGSFVLLLLFLNNVELNIVLSEQGGNSTRHNVYHYYLGLSLSSDVFERRTSTGSGPFSLLACFDSTKFVLLSIFILKETLAQTFVQYQGSRVQKFHFRLRCVPSRSKNISTFSHIEKEDRLWYPQDGECSARHDNNLHFSYSLIYTTRHNVYL